MKCYGCKFNLIGNFLYFLFVVFGIFSFYSILVVILFVFVLLIFRVEFMIYLMSICYSRIEDIFIINFIIIEFC